MWGAQVTSLWPGRSASLGTYGVRRGTYGSSRWELLDE